jgi:dipeptidyl aminopeptidase/acylaminoacyl peptidase
MVKAKGPLALSSGDHLGPYEIVSLLGTGGMGEVYRAHDPRLGRDVALKVLRKSSADAEHLARFTREARTAGSLNHANIVAVFDVGTEAGVPYVVTELLEGETLRAKLDRGPISYRKAVDYGIQIAQALDAAHAKGILHRDVKPANAFITTDGRVKLLDFGIAKLTEQDASTTAGEPTVEDSHTGVVRGTAGYMSPEQVLGHDVDHRTDIFSLGSVLYEMFTGTRAFRRSSTVETMTAVLQQDPADPLTLNENLSSVAAAVVRRCLEKNKEERFQSARDLTFDLQQLRDLTGTLKQIRGPWLLRRKVLPALLAAAVALEGVALAVLLWPAPEPPAASFEQLTFSRGRIGGARFASAGHSVVYSEAREGTALKIWQLDLADTPSSRLLDYPPGSDVLAARAGEIALSLSRRFVLGERFVGTLAIAPIGSAPRPWAENIEDADWDPSGKQLAVVRSSGDAGGLSQIEYPIKHSLYQTANSIRFLRVSPDGQRLAFVEGAGGRGVSGRVSMVDMSGNVTHLTEEWGSVRGLAWSASGNEIWFTAGAARANRALRAVNLERKDRIVHAAPGSLTLWDIAPDGRVLMTRDEERRAVVARPPGGTAERDLSWFDDSGVSDISENGATILCGDRFGVYLRKTDGSPPIKLLDEGFADDLSRDGNAVIATIESNRKLLVVPTGTGDRKPVPTHGIVSYSGAQWFADGRRILFTGREEGKGLRSYVQDIGDGRPPQPVTPEKTWALALSPDETRIAVIGTGKPISIQQLTGGPQQPVKGSQEGERPVAWSDDGRSLYLFRRGEVPGHIMKLDIATGRRQTLHTLVPPDTAGVYSIIEVRVTPAGHAYAYSYSRLLSQLYLVRDLK